MSTHIELEYQKLLAAWQRAEMIPQVDPAEWRKDRAGRVMRFSDYRKHTPYGWREIDLTPKLQRPTDLCLEAMQHDSISKRQPKAG
jgi:hypothetical protein